MRGPLPEGDSTESARSASLPAGLTWLGHYKLLQQIGEGGMGTVWMAEQEAPVRRRVALKLIKSGVDNKHIVARFEAERQALAMMDHQNIAKILDAGTTESGQPYFVMELVQGIPLTRYCDKNKLSINERLELFISVCQAVQHAHQKGIIHRDIKPSNVLVCLYDGKPVPKIIDFGLAKALQHQTRLTDKTMFTEFGQVVGTLQYMSPEQAEMNQLDIDTRTDIYSLGVMLYELLTGSTPIDQETLKREAIFNVLESIREKEPPRPSVRLNSSTNEAISGISQQRRIEPSRLKNILRGELDWIVMKALEKDRTRRYETATGFAGDLKRYLAGEIVTARPPSTSYRVSKFVRKHKGLLASLTSIFCLLIAGIAGIGWFAFQANRARIFADAKTAEVIQEKARVEQREQEAIEAVRRFGDSVAENPDLKNRPELESLRKTLLNEPLVYFKSLRELLLADADQNPKSLGRLAEAAADLGDLTFEIGDMQNALTAYREALSIFERLSRDNPNVTEYQIALARCHNNLGILLIETGKPEQSLAAYQRAHDIWESLTRANATVIEFQSQLASSYNNIGNLLSKTGKPEEALTTLQRALEIRESLTHANPTVIEFQSQLAGSHNNIGLLLNETGRPEEALAAYQRALEIWESLARAYPTDITYKNGLALSHNNIGLFLRQTGKPAEALAAYQRALEIQESLALANPTVIEFQSQLAGSHNNIGLLLNETGRPEEALAAYQQALKIQESLALANPTVIEFHDKLAFGHGCMGILFRKIGKEENALAAYQQAIEIQERLASGNPTITRYQSGLAGSHNNMGLLLDETGKPDEALAAFLRALEIQENLARLYPSVAEFQTNLATSHNNIGNLLSKTGKPEEALTTLQRALEIRESLAHANPTVIKFQSQLAGSHNNIGLLLNETGRPEEALAAYQQALKIQESLARDNPSDSDLQSSAGASLNNLATLALPAKRFNEARDNLIKAIGYQKRALVAYPNHPEYRQFLKNHYTNLLQAADGLGDHDLQLEGLRGLVELAQPQGDTLNEEYASAINSLIWELVKGPTDTAHPAIASDDLASLRRAVEQFPKGHYDRTLGAGEYRMANYQAAIEACTKSLELSAHDQSLPGPNPLDLAILAMSHFQLVHHDQANQFRDQMIEAMKHSSFKDDPECQGFAQEVEQLFQNDPDQ